MLAKTETRKLPANTELLKLAFGGASCKGIKSQNEDAFAYHLTKGQQGLTKGNLAIIADGVSNASQAQEASNYCIFQFKNEYYQTPETWSTQHTISQLLRDINSSLFNRSSALDNSLHQPLSAQWLTTVSGIVFKSASAHIFHVGDSRVARIRNKQLKVLTASHNRQLASHTSVLTRAIGADSHLKVDYCQHALISGDIYILTTDGVHDFISTKEILELINSIDDLNLASRLIVERAKNNGSNDNLTCVLVKTVTAPSFKANEIRQQLFTKVIPPVLHVGQRLDNFEILHSIHNSPRSHLYLVRDVNNDRQFILKAPSKNFEDDEFYLQGFIRESWIGEKIDHPCMMKIHHSNSGSQFLYHICEYIDGQNLRQWMYDHPHPSIDQVRKIISQIADALRLLKRMEIVHRDLKPDNLMIDRQGQIKLIDYGTVSIASLDENINVLTDNSPQGTLNYMAPETLNDLSTGYQSDLFSLGVITYEMLTGELPYPPKENYNNLSKKKRLWVYQSALAHRKDLPFWLDLTLSKAVATDPKTRYEAYSQFIVDLSRPNLGAEKEYLNRPLLERDPLKFWQTLCGILVILLTISLF